MKCGNAAGQPQPVAPLKLEWPSDLVQIETDPEKARAAVAPEEDERVVPSPRRVRPAPDRFQTSRWSRWKRAGHDLPLAGVANEREPANPSYRL